MSGRPPTLSGPRSPAAAPSGAVGLARATTTTSPGTLAPQRVAAVARAYTPAEAIATVDAGAHMLAVMPLWEVGEPGQLLIPSGLATMGFAPPAAIAAALCAPASRWWRSPGTAAWA